MQDNITALNIEEGYKNNKTIKVVPGKHAKPAKLSSGGTFKTKTAAIMSKVEVPETKMEAAPATETTEPKVEQPVANQASSIPAQPSTPVENQTPVAQTPVTQAPETQPMTPDLPTDEKVLKKITNLNISYVEPSLKIKDAGSRRLKISSTVVTRTGNTLKVMLNNKPSTLEEVQTPPVAMDTQVLSETQEPVAQAPQMQEPTQETMAPEASEVTNPNADFFLGQKLNTGEIEKEETELTETEVQEPLTEEAPSTEANVITQEEKDARLNEILDKNQSSTNIIDFSEAQKALEEIANRKKELSQLEKEMEEARRIRQTQNEELQQLLADAPKIIADLDRDKMSRTEELSNLRAEIIQYSDLIQQNRGFQGNPHEEYNEESEVSYGRARG